MHTPEDTPTAYPRTYPASGPIDIAVRIFAGNVHVTGVNGTEVEVNLQPSNGGDGKALKVIEASRVELIDGSLKVDIPKPNSSLFTGRSPGVDVHITAPVGSTAVVESGSADVVVDQGLGDAEVRSGSGDVFTDACANVLVTTGSGDVRVNDVSAVNASTGSGDISVTKCPGVVDVNTASGDIEVDHVASASSAKTASGDIVVYEADTELKVNTASGDVTVRRLLSGEISATTASGDITLGVAIGTAAKLDLSSVTGQLASELDGVEAPTENDRVATVKARSVSGAITLVRAA